MDNETITSIKYKVRHKVNTIEYSVKYTIESRKDGNGWYWTCSDLFDGVNHFCADFASGPYDTIELAMDNFNIWIARQLQVAGTGL